MGHPPGVQNIDPQAYTDRIPDGMVIPTMIVGMVIPHVDVGVFLARYQIDQCWYQQRRQLLARALGYEQW